MYHANEPVATTVGNGEILAGDALTVLPKLADHEFQLTTAASVEELGRKWVGIELNAKYREISRKRIADVLATPEFRLESGDLTDRSIE